MTFCYLHREFDVERRNGDDALERLRLFFRDKPTEEAERQSVPPMHGPTSNHRVLRQFIVTRNISALCIVNSNRNYPEVCASREVKELFDATRSPTIDLYFDVVLPAARVADADIRSIRSPSPRLRLAPTPTRLARHLIKWSRPLGRRETSQSSSASLPTTKEVDYVTTRVLLDGIRALGENYKAGHNARKALSLLQRGTPSDFFRVLALCCFYLLRFRGFHRFEIEVSEYGFVLVALVSILFAQAQNIPSKSSHRSLRPLPR